MAEDAFHRYWDSQRGTCAVKVLPGGFYVSTGDEMIVTVLGSCVAACIRDPARGIGGMNHFMLPVPAEPSLFDANNPVSRSARYGSWAMEYLINEILKAGGSRRSLEVKVFGGGKLFSLQTDVGQRNVDFVHRYLECEALAIAAEDVGGNYARKILYFPATGVVKMRKLESAHDATLARRERRYQDRLLDQSQDGSVELFE